MGIRWKSFLMVKPIVTILFCGLALAGAFWLLSPDESTTSAVAEVITELPKTDPLVGAAANAETEAEIIEVAPVVSKTGPWPKVVAPETTLSFGRMELYEEREHRFEIRNEGEVPLELSTGKSTCQCTLFSLESKTVAPGESTWLRVKWRPKSRDNTFRHGGPVFTNDPENEQLYFAVQGGVDAPIEVRPEELWDVGAVSDSRPGLITVMAGSRIHKDFKIESIDTASEFVTFEINPMTPEMLLRDNYVGGYAIDFTVSSEIPSGRFSTMVTMNVEHARGPVQSKLTAVKRGSIRILPAPGTVFDPDDMTVRFGQFAASAGRTLRLQLIVDEKDMTEPFRLQIAKAEPSFLEFKLEPVGESTSTVKRYWLTLTIPPGKPRTSLTFDQPGSLELSTNHPEDTAILFIVEMSSS